jgi:hypothetical protein
MIDRKTCIHLIHAAEIAKRPDFARMLATDWLAAWPGDHEVAYLLAQIEAAQGLNHPAIDRLSGLILADPESAHAYDALSKVLRKAGYPTRATVIEACGAALRGLEVERTKAPSWAFALSRAVKSIHKGDTREAQVAAQQVLSADPEIPLPTLIAVKAHLEAGDRAAAYALARMGCDRWPECVPFRLVVADELMTSGETGRGVEYLHRAVADDPTGEQVRRLLGDDHPYRDLWPASLTIESTRPVPAEVAAVLGDNRLASGPASTHSASQDVEGAPAQTEPVPQADLSPAPARTEAPASPPPSPQTPADENALPTPEPWEAFRGPDPGDSHEDGASNASPVDEVRAEFDRIAESLNLAHRSTDEDNRSPAYIVLSNRTPLIQSFGVDRFRRLDEALMSLVQSVRRRPGWSAYRLYMDDPATLEGFGIAPVDPGNAWQIKLRLADLDHELAKRGEMIGALLIIGGHKTVPFHMLPNPTDDDDDSVASDNPYATTDENYFAPEWPVGRLPSDDDLELLVKQVRSATDAQLVAIRAVTPWMRVQLAVSAFLNRLLHRHVPALGYSASIWRRASLAVFRTIGDPAAMFTSPPVEAGALPAAAAVPTRLSYFNLHGIADGPEWFGQRDPLRDKEADTEFPVALRPEDVVNSGRAPRIVFTEACYGANVLDKSAETALCLKFLASGTHAIVGSTKVSYGSVTPPLIGADLLGRLFWEGLNQGLPAGEALRRAKLGLAGVMHRRQSYLDGEDQKTLISFILYGDPLYTPGNAPAVKGRKSVIRRSSRPTQMKTACALGGRDLTEQEIQSEALTRVKSIVAQYLPGLSDAECHIHPQHCGCDGQGHMCPTHQLGIKVGAADDKQTYVVTFSKQIPSGSRHHSHYARLTLDPSGKVLKLAVSR